MNYSKKHLKALLYAYLFNGVDFKTLDGILFRDTRELRFWDNQRERSLYRKCKRKGNCK